MAKNRPKFSKCSKKVKKCKIAKITKVDWNFRNFQKKVKNFKNCRKCKNRLKFSKFSEKSQKFQKLQKMQKSTKIFEIFKKKVKTFKNCKKCKNRPEKYEKKSKNYQLSNTPFHKFQRNLMWRQNRQRWRPSSDAECKHWSTMTSYWISREFMKRSILQLLVKMVQRGKAESNKAIKQ